MSDTGEILFGKFPPAAPFDERLRGFDLRVLLALALRCDFRTMTTDHSGVQLAQDFAVNRRAVVRSLDTLVKAGYLAPDGRSRRHGNRYRVVLDNRPPGASVPHAAPASTIPGAGAVFPVAPGTLVSHPPGTQVSQSGVTLVSQGAAVTWDTGVTSPETQVSHSLELSREKETNGRPQAPEVVGPGGPAQYWSLPLEASDLEAGTTLVQTARDLGFARSNGVDGLQEQHAAFLRHRKNRNYRKPAKRSEFRWWLQKAQQLRATVTTPAEAKAPADAHPIAEKPVSSVTLIPVAGAPGVAPAMLAAWRQAVNDLAREIGDSTARARFGQGAAMLRIDNGAAVIAVAQKNLGMVRDVYGKKIAAAWSKHMPAVALEIVAAHPTRGGTVQHAAE